MVLELFDAIPGDVYANSKSQLRQDYEKRIQKVKDKKAFKDEMRRIMVNVNNGISMEVDIGDNEDKRLAFTEALRVIHSRRNKNYKAVVKAYTLSGKYK